MPLTTSYRMFVIKRFIFLPLQMVFLLHDAGCDAAVCPYLFHRHESACPHTSMMEPAAAAAAVDRYSVHEYACTCSQRKQSYAYGCHFVPNVRANVTPWVRRSLTWPNLVRRDYSRRALVWWRHRLATHGDWTDWTSVMRMSKP